MDDDGRREWMEAGLWTEVVWAARDAAGPAMNQARQARFEQRKAALAADRMATRMKDRMEGGR